MEPRRILIVANQTAGGAHLAKVVRKELENGPATFTLLVPASAPSDGAWSEGQARAAAEDRLREGLAALREAGAEVEGMVGDHRPIHAITDALVTQLHDAIIVSTFPSGVSRWLKQDLPHRVERVFRLPTTHVVAETAHKG
jgi:GABA permease